MSRLFELPKLTYRELSTVLAALRAFQKMESDEIKEMPHFLDVEPLTVKRQANRQPVRSAQFLILRTDSQDTDFGG